MWVNGSWNNRDQNNCDNQNLGKRNGEKQPKGMTQHNNK